MAKAILKCLESKIIILICLVIQWENDNSEIAKISGSKINKLVCFATGSIGDIPGRFETIETSRERLKNEGIKEFIKEFQKNGSEGR